MDSTVEFDNQISPLCATTWLAQPMDYWLHTPQPTPNVEEDEDDEDDDSGGGSGGGNIDPEDDEGWSDDDEDDEDDETLWTASVAAQGNLSLKRS